ncbi:MAG: NAD(P)H-dependent FMN reductase [Candidatus Poriferisodalaceae bacterium]|jgi:NAD(P)H-dependent FMN reductase
MADATPLNLVAICGSFRADSFNGSLLRAAQRLVGEGVTMTQIDITDVPLFNQDVEAAGDPKSVTTLKTAVKDSNGVLIVTPEYNWGVPAVTKNAVDWLSRPFMNGSIKGKPVALAGATLGRGAVANCLRHLSESVAILSDGLFSNTHGVGGVTDLMDDGEFANHDACVELAAWLAEFAEHARSHNAAVAAAVALVDGA